MNPRSSATTDSWPPALRRRLGIPPPPFAATPADDGAASSASKRNDSGSSSDSSDSESDNNAVAYYNSSASFLAAASGAIPATTSSAAASSSLSTNELRKYIHSSYAALTSIQRQLHRGEESYFEETYSHGNIFMGWDNIWIEHPNSSTGGVSTSSSVGGGGNNNASGAVGGEDHGSTNSGADPNNAAQAKHAAPQKLIPVRKMPADHRWFSSSCGTILPTGDGRIGLLENRVSLMDRPSTPEPEVKFAATVPIVKREDAKKIDGAKKKGRAKKNAMKKEKEESEVMEVDASSPEKNQPATKADASAESDNVSSANGALDGTKSCSKKGDIKKCNEDTTSTSNVELTKRLSTAKETTILLDAEAMGDATNTTRQTDEQKLLGGMPVESKKVEPYDALSPETEMTDSENAKKCDEQPSTDADTDDALIPTPDVKSMNVESSESVDEVKDAGATKKENAPSPEVVEKDPMGSAPVLDTVEKNEEVECDNDTSKGNNTLDAQLPPPAEKDQGPSDSNAFEAVQPATNVTVTQPPTNNLADGTSTGVSASSTADAVAALEGLLTLGAGGSRAPPLAPSSSRPKHPPPHSSIASSKRPRLRKDG